MPDWRPDIASRLGGLRLDPAREAEIIEELSEHLDQRYDELLSEGATADEAFRTAVSELSTRRHWRRPCGHCARHASDRASLATRGSHASLPISFRMGHSHYANWCGRLSSPLSLS